MIDRLRRASENQAMRIVLVAALLALPASARTFVDGGTCPPDPPTGISDLGDSVETLLAGGAAGAVKKPKGLEAALRAAAESGRVPDDFKVVYDDVHPMWGGAVMSVGADGAAKKSAKNRGATTESTAKAKGEALAGLARTLVEIKAWEQPWESPTGGPPDSSFAKLTVTAGGETVTLAEPFNDLAKIDRIARVKKGLEGLFAGPAPAP